MSGAHGFEGFAKAAPAFLRALAANNERAWFAAHRDEYESLVRDPLYRLVTSLASAMRAIDAGFETDPRRAVSRIHRDTRFSRDKTPYRVNQWLAFKRPGPEWAERPAFFLEIAPDGWRCGMGYYAAGPAVMAAVRERIAARPRAFRAAMAQATAAGFAVAGDEYKRPKVPEGVSGAAAEWYRRKTVYLVRNRPLEPLFFRTALAADVAKRFQALAGMYRFMEGVAD